MAIRWTSKKKKRTAKPQMRRALLKIDGRTVEVSLRANPRARRYIVKVDPITGEVLVTAPSSRSLADALDFAKKEKDWIAGMLANVPAPIELNLGAPILYCGVLHVLLRGEATESGMRRGPVWIDDAAPLPTIRVTGRHEHVPRRVCDWLKAEARRRIGERVAEYSRDLDVRPKRVTIRDTTSRWGSCSSLNYLSFSWRLVMAPAHVLDYVVAHEVAHLRELNHEPSFWRLVEKLVPHTKRSQAWLDEHGTTLYRYAPRARKP
jgi:predicted metal-dependent hydrolase